MGLIGRSFEGPEKGHFFFYGTVFVLIVEDMESICGLWVVIFNVAVVLFVVLL